MNSTKDTDTEGGSELRDGDSWSEEHEPVFKKGLRRSKRQVSVQNDSFFTHTDGLPGTCGMKRSKCHQEGNIRVKMCKHNQYFTEKSV